MAKIKDIFRHQFVKSGVIVLVGSFVVNVLNYVFNLVMGRMLSPTEFGAVVALFSLTIIIGIPAEALAKVMAKNISIYNAKHEEELIDALFKTSNEYSLYSGFLFFIFFLFFSPWISSFLQVGIFPILIFGLLIPLSFLRGTVSGMFQGLQDFVSFSLVGVISTVLKLVLGIIFVLLGFSVSGVMLALAFSFLGSYLYGLSKTKTHLRADKNKQIKKTILSLVTKNVAKSAPVIFGATLLLALFTNIDVVLAKHYLSPYLAGQYAALSVIGKIVIYGAMSLVVVMFPMASASHAKQKGEEMDILETSLGTMFTASLSVVIAFWFFSEFVIKLFLGEKYLMIAPYLGVFGFVMLLNVMVIVFAHYFMAIHNKIFLYPFGISVLMQITLIVLFHKNIFEIIMSLLISSMFALLSMSVVYIKS